MKNNGLVSRLFLDRREYTKRAFSEADPVLRLTGSTVAMGGCQCVNCNSCNNGCNK